MSSTWFDSSARINYEVVEWLSLGAAAVLVARRQRDGKSKMENKLGYHDVFRYIAALYARRLAPVPLVL